MEKNTCDIKIYLSTDNKTGYKSKKNHIRKNFPDLFHKITDFSYKYELTGVSFLELLFLYTNNLSEIPKCPECGKQLKFKRSFNEGYGKYCSIKCTNQSIEHIEKVKSTNVEKYGGQSPIHSKKIKEKIKSTNIEKYGVDNIFKDPEYIKKRVLKKHNESHISKLKSTKEKIKKTNIEKYGVSTPLLLPNSRINLNGKLSEKFKEKYNHLNILSINHDDITIKCDLCHNDYVINRHVLYHRNEITENPCVLCNPIKNGTSISESEIGDFIKSLGIKYEKNNRTILNGQEIDIFIPSHNIAIEYNGLYWHSEKYCEDTYHMDKTDECEKKNVQLIHIFEDEWVYKKSIVKSRIKHILKLTENKIFARKCSIKKLTSLQFKEFMNENHIQGNVNSSIKVGLFYNDQLVSAMSFGKKRISLGSNPNNNEYELLRFCNKLDSSVIGGANRLLKWFVNEYNPEHIISYCDRRWSNGNVYKTMGFELIKKTNPNYFYIIGSKRENRFKYRKDQLVKNGFDSSLTEREIMFNRKIYRIYDSGSFLFKLEKT